jgi:hypothetical protein
MTTPAFPVRFKDPATKEMLRVVSDQLGVSMNDVAESAIRNELILLGAGIEQQLTEIVELLRNYDADRDFDRFVEAVGAGEELGDPLQATRIEPDRARAGIPIATVPRVKAFSAKSKKGAERTTELTGALASFKKR